MPVVWNFALSPRIRQTIFPAMIRIKTLSLPIASALIAATVVPASAQLSLELSSQKTYRQSKGGIVFTGGRFDVNLRDGAVSTIGYCNDRFYYPPGAYINICSPGTSGYLSSGNINSATEQFPYLVITYLNGAASIAPREENRIQLISAPASKLTRPAGGFTDDSASVYYNLHVPESQREYFLTRYNNARTYTKSQRGKFEAEIVTGVYRYSFPRLGRPEIPAPLTAVVYPMTEGFSKKNNKKSGFIFSNTNRWKGGFMELSYRKPNKISWNGLTRDGVFVAVDDLYFSIRELRTPSRPATSEVIRGNAAIFPAFTNGDAPRLLLRSPVTSSFSIPPIFPSGTKGMVELELQRGFQTGGATYDFSRRRFQVPVVVIDRFTDFAETFLPKKKNATILQDSDGDGVNNLNEWILDSNPDESTSVPIAPTPQPLDENGAPAEDGFEFGFNVVMKKGTVPKVRYILQRSRDAGKTWSSFTATTDPESWNIRRARYEQRGIFVDRIEVRSFTGAQPAGTASDIYRVKIVLAAKKK